MMRTYAANIVTSFKRVSSCGCGNATHDTTTVEAPPGEGRTRHAAPIKAPQNDVAADAGADTKTRRPVLDNHLWLCTRGYHAAGGSVARLNIHAARTARWPKRGHALSICWMAPGTRLHSPEWRQPLPDRCAAMGQ
jgi:hypothetical protein